MHEREVVGAAEFEDEGVEGGRGVLDIGVARVAKSKIWLAV